MNYPSRRASGFTLIEVLITMSVLAMVMLTGAWAYSFMSQNWQRNSTAFNTAMDEHTDWSLVQRAVSNTLPKIVRDDDGQLGFYFLGRENGFTGITQVSVQEPESPAVFRLFREQNPDSGGWRLVYEEAVLRDVALVRADQQLPFNFRLVVEDDLDEAMFEYYGWENLRAWIESGSETSDVAGSPEWFTDYDGLERGQHPTVIQIHINDFIWPVTVPDNSSQLRRRASDNNV